MTKAATEKIQQLRPLRRRWPHTFNDPKALEAIFVAMRDVEPDLVDAAVANALTLGSPPTPLRLRRLAFMHVLMQQHQTTQWIFDQIVDAVEGLTPGDDFEWPGSVPVWARNLWSSSGLATLRHSAPRHELRKEWIKLTTQLVEEHARTWNGRRDTVDLSRSPHTSPRSTGQ